MSTTDVSPQPPQPRKQYIGDGVYAHFDGYQIWLTTLDGMAIALEPNVYTVLRAYAFQIWKD